MIKTEAKRPSSDQTPPLISVIMPVYNAERTLAAAIDSILAQTFGRYEVIIVDDGSTDKSVNIVKRYQKQDPRIRLAACAHRGLVPTLNEAIALACGEWIARMDADDIALPQRFERQLNWLEETGADLTGSWAKCFGGWPRRTLKPYLSDDAIKTEMLFKSPFVHPTVVLRGSLAKRLKYEPKVAEDYDLWVRAANGGYKMCNCPEVLLLYRTHSMQITSKHLGELLHSGSDVRAQYWMGAKERFGLSEGGIREVLKLIALDTSANLDIAGDAIITLLSKTRGEAQKAVAENTTRLYLKAAANHPNIVEQWRRLGCSSPLVGATTGELKFRLARLLKMREGSRWYRLIRRLLLFLPT